MAVEAGKGVDEKEVTGISGGLDVHDFTARWTTRASPSF